MELSFDIGGVPATYRRNSFNGRADLDVDGELIPVQSVRQLSTHFSFRTEHVWRHPVGGHQVVIVKRRPLLLGGLRRNIFTVAVDGQVVARATGR